MAAVDDSNSSRGAVAAAVFVFSGGVDALVIALTLLVQVPVYSEGAEDGEGTGAGAAVFALGDGVPGLVQA